MSETKTRDLSQIPLTGWGRHEIEAEIVLLRARIDTLLAEVVELKMTGGLCSMCAGTGRNLLGIGPSCRVCDGTGHRAKEVAGLYRCLENADKAYEEVKQKADSHRRQRDELNAKLAKKEGPYE